MDDSNSSHVAILLIVLIGVSALTVGYILTRSGPESNIEVEELKVSRDEVTSGNPVVVEVIVSNLGKTEGTKKISLKVEGEEVDKREISLKPDDKQKISFEIIREKLGAYELEVGEMSRTIEVLEPAKFKMVDLELSDNEISLGENLLVSALVRNTGGSEKIMTLTSTFGDKSKKKSISLDGGQRGNVNFEFSPEQEGVFQASVENLSRRVKVKKPLLEVSAPEWVMSGENAEIRVTSNGEPVKNAMVNYSYKPFFSSNWVENNSSVKTGEDGEVLLKFRKAGDYNIKVRKEGYEGKSEVLFEDTATNPKNWYVNSNCLRRGFQEFFNEAFENHHRINTYPSKRGKTFFRPRVLGKDNSFDRWDDFSLKFRFKILRLDGGLRVNFRRNTRGYYSLNLDRGTDPFLLTKTYPNRDYEHEDNEKRLIMPDIHTEKVDVKKVGVWHKVEIIAVKNEITVKLDNQLVLSYVDDASEGLAKPFEEGIFEFETHKKIDVLIDNLVLKEILPDSNKVTEVVRAYPRGNSQIPIRGAKDKNPSVSIRYRDARTVGANWVQRNHTFWIDSDNYSLNSHEYSTVGFKDNLAIKDYIKKAKYRGMKVFYYPRIEWEKGVISGKEGIPSSSQDEFLQNAVETAVKAAKFAEKNKVDMFAPITNIHKYIPQDVANQYYQEILPKVRRVFDGKIVKGKNPMNSNPKKYDFTRFDYITINTGMGQNYEGYGEKIGEMIKVGKILSEKYGDKGLIIPNAVPLPLESFFMRQLEKKGKVENVQGKFYDIFFQETIGQIDGVFIGYRWSEHPDVGLYTKEPLSEMEIHGEAWFKGYLGPGVSKYVKKYYSSQYNHPKQ